MLNKIIKEDINSIIELDNIMRYIRGNTILLTGATGFVGSYIAYSILQDSIVHKSDTKLIMLVRNKTKAIDIFYEYYNSGLITIIEQDIVKDINYSENIDYIIHCASNAAPKEYFNDPVGTILTNIYGTNNLLNLAKSKNVKKFLYLSTIEIYGQVDKSVIEESDYGYISPITPRSCYPLSKKTCENLCISYAEQYGININIARLSYLFGPGMKKDDSKIVAQFARSISDEKNLILKSSGLQKRSYCYITDAITGLFTVLVKGENKQEYNITSKHCITTLKGLAEKFISIYPEKNLKVLYEIPTELEVKQFTNIDDSVLSTQKLEGIGWDSKVSLEVGLKRMVESLY